MIKVKANKKLFLFKDDSDILNTLETQAEEVKELKVPEKLPGYSVDGKLYTHDIAANVTDLFEDLLADKGIVVPCASEDEEKDREDTEDAASLYGSEYSDLIDEVENLICEALDAYDDEYIRDEFSGNC